jgi:hypothetical protein
MTARFIKALAALAGALTGVAVPAAADNPASETAASLVDPAAEVLTLEQERNRRLTLPVLVEGAGPFAFMIDTGSQATAVTHEIRIAANLPAAGTATLVGMASRREVDLVDVARIDFGSNSFTNFAQIMWRNICRHTHCNAGRSIDQ